MNRRNHVECTGKSHDVVDADVGVEALVALKNLAQRENVSLETIVESVVFTTTLRLSKKRNKAMIERFMIGFTMAIGAKNVMKLAANG